MNNGDTGQEPAAQQESKQRPYYWNRSFPTSGPPGEDLAALRRGFAAEPGSVPEMWRFYTRLDDAGHGGIWLTAEHYALSLFGVHQQSQRSPMHRSGTRLGEALRDLRNSGRYSEEALDRRVTQCATADTLNEMARHLRSLVSMLKALPSPGLDYNQLVQMFVAWQRPGSRPKARRQLGADYFRSPKSAAPDSDPNSSTTSVSEPKKES